MTPKKFKPPAGAVVLSDGTWATFGRMTGRDFRLIASLSAKADAEDPGSIGDLLDLVERRCTGASVPDILDLPIETITALAARWLGGAEDQALPPESAPG